MLGTVLRARDLRRVLGLDFHSDSLHVQATTSAIDAKRRSFLGKRTNGLHNALQPDRPPQVDF